MNIFGNPKPSSTNSDMSKSIVGIKKTPEQLAAEAAAEKERIADANAIEMKTLTTATTATTDVGGRRRKSRRGKSRKYKRTLKRRKNNNKTKNRK
jgi:hypothetical protein